MVSVLSSMGRLEKSLGQKCEFECYPGVSELSPVLSPQPTQQLHDMEPGTENQLLPGSALSGCRREVHGGYVWDEEGACATVRGPHGQGMRGPGSSQTVAVDLVREEIEESHWGWDSCCPWGPRRGPEPAGSGQEVSTLESKSKDVS